MSLLLTAIASLLMPSQGTPPALQVLTPNGLQPLSDSVPSSAFLAPLTSLSEYVTRPETTGGTVDLAVKGRGLARVAAIVHGRGEAVVLDGETPLVVEGWTCARGVLGLNERGGRGATFDVAHVARRDGTTVSAPMLRVFMPEGWPAEERRDAARVLVFGSVRPGDSSKPVTITVAGKERRLRNHPLRPLVLDASALRKDGAPVLDLELGSAAVDAIVFGYASAPRAVHDLKAFDSPAASEGAAASRSFALGESVDRALDDESNAITVSIVLEGDVVDAPLEEGPGPMSQPLLSDESLARGVDFVHFEGEAEQLDIRPTMGPGAAWGDVNADGLLDLVILQGAGRAGTNPLRDRLYLGSEEGHFTDATMDAQLAEGDAGMGALLVDLNGDGALDLYCANYGQDRLFLGAGDGTFSEADVLPRLDLWSASASAADYDGDGDLDLYITSYLDYDPAKMPPIEELGGYSREDPVEMLPFAFPGARNVLLRNRLVEDGKLGFDDVTEELGLLDVQGRGMQSVFWDFDRDGDVDLYVANDVSFNVLFRNEGDGTFKDVSFSAGLDDPRGGMGLAVGDVDRDGDEDIFLTNWELESNALYLNSVASRTGAKRRRAAFRDYTVRSGIGPSGIGKTSWGADFFDLELDGDLDVYVANGYTSPDYESTGICVGQRNQLFLGDGKARFEEVDAALTDQASLASRGAIGADFDRDGDIDLIVTANNGPAALLVNVAERKGRFVGLTLRQPGPNRFAIGADVEIKTPDGVIRRQSLRAGQGYLTGNPAELHFGVGPQGDGEVTVSIRWPDGESTTHSAELDAWTTVQR